MIGAGALAGIALGIVARGWMRLISTDPEFTWNGSAFIVMGFGLFGVGQATVIAVRARGARWRRVVAARVFGGFTILPLFVAAGAIMAPTVVSASLATSRTDWRRRTRWILAAVATVLPLYVASTIIADFGYSPRALAGILGLVGVYALIVLTAQATFAPQPDSVPLRRSTRRLIVVGAAAAVALFLYLGGITN